MQMQWRRREAMLAGILLLAAAGMLNHFSGPPLLAMHAGWYWAGDVAHYVVLPFVVGWWLLRPVGVTCADLGLRWKPARHEIDRSGPVLWVGAAFVLLTFTWPTYVVSSYWSFEYGEPVQWHQAAPAGWWPRAGLAVYLSATAALVEEAVFRALPWLYLREVIAPRWRVAVYLLVSTVLFAFCHTEQGIPGVWSAGWFGFVAALVYLRMRTLWPAVIGHFALDMLVFWPQ